MAWTASLPSVVTGNATKSSDYNNLLNNLLFRRDTATGDTTQLVAAAGSQTGWIKIYVGTTAQYIPYWAAI